MQTTEITDAMGRIFSDELSQFVLWYSEASLAVPFVPIEGGCSFVEGVTGLVLFRRGQFQVQLFIVDPSVTIPSHVHPNVDSYEVFLSGMQFTFEEEIVITHENALVKNEDTGSALARGYCIRVMPHEKHGGTASRGGGSFLSIQHWLNGVSPSSVGNDWEGDTMGDIHSSHAGRL